MADARSAALAARIAGVLPSGWTVDKAYQPRKNCLICLSHPQHGLLILKDYPVDETLLRLGYALADYGYTLGRKGRWEHALDLSGCADSRLELCGKPAKWRKMLHADGQKLLCERHFTAMESRGRDTKKLKGDVTDNEL